MSYAACLFLLAITAVKITGCRYQQQAVDTTSLQIEERDDHTHEASQRPQPSDEQSHGDRAPARDESHPNSQREPEQSGDDEEPLLLMEDDLPVRADDEPLLLLDSDEEEAFVATRQVADNSRCHHCHLNYIEEEIVAVHASVNISCADCHGNCDEHIADESWASGGNGTPPEVMYLREQVSAFCMTCHLQEEIKVPDHEDFFAGAVEEQTCTDCHGEHRLTERKCTWK